MVGKSQTKVVRLSEILRRRISCGEFKDRRLPSESQLMAEYGVGRETVRRAVAMLAEEGLVETVHGSGTRIRRVEPIIRLDADVLLAPAFANQRSTWGEECARQGIEGTVRILSARKVKAPRDVADRLGTTAAFLRRRLHLADGRPAGLLDTYYLEGLAVGTRIAKRQPVHPSVIEYLQSDFGIQFEKSRSMWMVRRAKDEEVAVLRLPKHAPVFDLTRVVTGVLPGEDEVVPIFVDRGVYSDRHQVVYELEL